MPGMLTTIDLSLLREFLRQADAPADSFASACGKPRAEAALQEAIRPHLRELLDLATAGLAQSMRLRFLAGAVYDLLAVLDLQARTWLVQHHPEIDDGLSTVEDILREFNFKDSDEEWYGEWAKLQKAQDRTPPVQTDRRAPR